MPASRADSPQTIRDLFTLEGDALKRAGFEEPAFVDWEEQAEFNKNLNRVTTVSEASRLDSDLGFEEQELDVAVEGLWGLYFGAYGVPKKGDTFGALDVMIRHDEVVGYLVTQHGLGEVEAQKLSFSAKEAARREILGLQE